MKVMLALLADAASTSPDGKLNVLGEFNAIRTKGIPFAWPRMCLVLKLQADEGETGTVPIEVRALAPDGEQLAEPAQLTVTFPARLPAGVPGSGGIILNIDQANFERYGEHRFEVRAGGKVLTHVSLYVLPLPEGVEPQI